LTEEPDSGRRISNMTTENPTNPSPTAPAVDPDAVAKKVTAGLRPAVRELRKEVEELRKHVEGQVAANPGATLSQDMLDRLHDVYENTGDEELGEILDEICDDPDCQDGDEDDEEEEG